MSKSEEIRQWFIKRKKATNREVIHKFDNLHGISDLVCTMKKNGHLIETERVKTAKAHFDIYHYKGVQK